jgi:hypothetical protein
VYLASAGVAQLAEHNVANVVVVSSNLITRSFFVSTQFKAAKTFGSQSFSLNPDWRFIGWHA